MILNINIFSAVQIKHGIHPQESRYFLLQNKEYVGFYTS